ncbi:MAG: T9SS type A sorting domain-containing protein [Saprospiraceae bacterium]
MKLCNGITRQIICITVLIMVLTIAGSTDSRADTWTQKANFGGLPRECGVAFSIGNKGYMGLGDYSLSSDWWEYNPLTNLWTQKANFGGGVRGRAVGFSIGNKGYVGTGWHGSNTDPDLTNDFWEYDPVTNIWTEKADLGGAPRQEAIGFSIGNYGYIGTGKGSSSNGGVFSTSDFWKYDPATDSWNQITTFSIYGSYAAVGFSIGNKGYLGTGAWTSNSLWEYDPVTDTWTQKADFEGDERTYATAFSIGNKGYIGTGMDGLYVRKDFWEYDPVTNSWTQKTDFGGAARAGASGFSIGTKGYIGLGGFENDFWEYTPDCKSFMVYADADGDSYGNASDILFTPDCIAPVGYVYGSTDCNDAVAAIHPGTTEICGGLDDDCNGITDDVMYPANLLSSLVTDSSAKLKWDAVASAYGYKIRYSTTGSNNWIIKNSTNLYKKITGLAGGVQYKWSVRTLCSVSPVNTSPWSPNETFITPLRMGNEAAGQKASLQLYPNPASDQVTLQFSLPQSSHISIKIFDTNGRAVKSLVDADMDEGSQSVRVYVKNLPKGIYFVRMVGLNEIENQKLIVE